MKWIHMMGIKLPRSKTLTIKDFKEDKIGKFRYRKGKYEIVFYEYTGAWAKMYIEVWYVEGDKKYRKEQEKVDRRFTTNKITIKESNRQWWYLINKFNKRYCREE